MAKKKPQALTKTEAVRRALDELGMDAIPADIQAFARRHFAIEISKKVVSIYKVKIARERSRRGRSGRKPKGGQTAAAAQAGESRGGVSFRDLRTLKAIGDRLGQAHLRELVELMA
jgi:hypothetical protein